MRWICPVPQLTDYSHLTALGAKVIATAGSAEKLRVCKEKGGADFALDYTKPDWQKEVLKITGGKGANVIYDPVGMIQPSLKCIAWNGRAVVVGFAAGSIEKVLGPILHVWPSECSADVWAIAKLKIPMNLVLLKNISLVGVHWVGDGLLAGSALQELTTPCRDLLLPCVQGAYTKNEKEKIPEVWAALLQLLREGLLRPVIFDRVYK